MESTPKPSIGDDNSLTIAAIAVPVAVALLLLVLYLYIKCVARKRKKVRQKPKQKAKVSRTLAGWPLKVVATSYFSFHSVMSE